MAFAIAWVWAVALALGASPSADPPPTACTEIGCGSGVHIELERLPAEARSARVCVDGRCGRRQQLARDPGGGGFVDARIPKSKRRAGAAVRVRLVLFRSRRPRGFTLPEARQGPPFDTQRAGLPAHVFPGGAALPRRPRPDPLKSAVTIGVYGFSAESFVEALRSANVRQLLDVRQRRGVRGSEYSWANSARLQAAMGEAKIAYYHLPELAPTTELREVQYREDDRLGVGKRSRAELAPEYVERYTHEILDARGPGAGRGGDARRGRGRSAVRGARPRGLPPHAHCRPPGGRARCGGHAPAAAGGVIPAVHTG